MIDNFYLPITVYLPQVAQCYGLLMSGYILNATFTEESEKVLHWRELFV